MKVEKPEVHIIDPGVGESQCYDERVRINKKKHIKIICKENIMRFGESLAVNQRWRTGKNLKID